MSEPENPKPRPARLTENEPQSGGSKPTPVRELAGAEPRGAAPEGRPVEPGEAERLTEPDLPEATLDVDGTRWTVRVLGRAGSGGRSPPLLLLGFWDGDEPGGDPSREATVVARTLFEMTPGRLEVALGESSPPPASDRRKPFFEGASQGRRGGPQRHDS